MTCNPGDPCFPTSLAGRVIHGRSTSGFDVRARPQIYARTEGEPLDHIMDYYPGVEGLTPEQQKFKHYGYYVDSDNPGRAGVPLTEEERKARHYAHYGTTDLPPRGTGLGNNPGRAGIPLTDAERKAQHYARYGTTDLPPRGTGLGIQRLEGPDLGSFIAGVTIGFIIGGMLLTATGRRIGYRIGERIERRI